MALLDENLDTIKLFIDDQPVVLSRCITENGARLYEGVLPRDSLEKTKGLARLNFQVSKPARANKFNPRSSDDRKLGVVISWIEIAPLN